MIYHNIMRRTLAVLSTGLVLGVMFAGSAHAGIYRLGSNYVAGTTAPYNSGGGVPAAALLNLNTNRGTNITLSWYGMQGWYAVQGSTNLTDWVTLTNVKSSGYAATSTIANPFGLSASFRLNHTNSFAGSQACSGCHGDKYAEYLGTGHATALSLIMDSNGNFTGHASKSCIKCHTVGYGQATGYEYNTNAASFTSPLANVGCENCHGPAGWHKDSDHYNIHPAVSVDPAICGSCHQGSHHPEYTEYTQNTSAGHARTSRSGSFGCAFCHQATTRMVMLNEYKDKLAGRPHALDLPTGTDVQPWTATCVTCHDPHSAQYEGQLRHPMASTNFFTMPTITDVRSVVTTNVMGIVSTNSVSMNTVFDSLYNPNIQICGQCHNHRGYRWDGTAYNLITNTVVGSAVTNTSFVDLVTNVTVTQVFTNSSGVPYLTNSYSYPYVYGRRATNVVVIPTNQIVGVTNLTQYVTYTYNGVTATATNADGSYAVKSSFGSPHPTAQYNMLIGILDKDFNNTNGYSLAPTNNMHTHGNPARNTKQCVQCHVVSYALNSSTNISGHTFEVDTVGCMISGCHSSYTHEGLEWKIEDLQTTTSNSMRRVVTLLNQWATNIAPAILRTNYQQLAWEFTSPGTFGTKSTNAGVKYLNGPPGAFVWKTNALVPSGTNDNLQLVIPADIRQARYELYMINSDSSYGVHNPTYVPRLLADAENRVLGQFAQSGYAAYFAAKTLTGWAPLSVTFTNYSTSFTTAAWNFGDGQDYSAYTAANPTYIYTNAGLYSVKFTADGTQNFTRSQYIKALAKPVVSFSANATAVTAGQTVTFTNTSSNTGDVFLWRWSPMFGVSGAPSYDLAPGEVFSFTYTNAGTYSVSLRASCPGGSSYRVTGTNTAFIVVSP